VIEIKMPRLSDTMEEGAISTWRKHPGDTVAIGDVLVEIETDKAVMEYEAYQGGTLSKILVDEGQVAQIGAAIALIDDGTGSGASAAPADADNSPATDSPATPVDNSKVPSGEGNGAVDAAAGTAGRAANGAAANGAAANGAAASGAAANGAADTRRMASPLVRKLARENRLDLSHVQGTGPGGRIIRADLSGLLSDTPAAPATASASARQAPPTAALPASATPPATPLPASATPPATRVPVASQVAAHPAAAAAVAPSGTTGDPSDVRGSRAVPLSQVRRVIARRLSASAREIPHFYVTAAADAEELMRLRADLNARLTAAGRPKVSVNDLLIRAVALALRQHPEANVSYVDDEATTMLVHDRVNIGVAVAADSGLIVPVIRDADTKTVTQLGAEAKELVRLAGERKLTPAQTGGGTFTISNLGMFGVSDFTAIINPPEAAILAVGATIREPAVVGDEIVPRYRLRYTLSSDHRVIDGALAAQFLKTLTSLIESPWLIVA
jgi:pyruvate dehydrogenase E2 component (dihydrolipoamide acetyltransferase)